MKPLLMRINNFEHFTAYNITEIRIYYLLIHRAFKLIQCCMSVSETNEEEMIMLFYE